MEIPAPRTISEPLGPTAGTAPTPVEPDPALLVEAVRKLVDDTGSEVLRREWRRLYARANEPHFSVVVVGEFSRGKSTLINRLLGAEILPVGAIPTTIRLTRVLYAPEPALVGLLPGGSREILSAAPAEWPQVLGGLAETEPPRWIAFQCGLPDSWLRETGLQLIDTPGAGDLASARSEEVIDAIAVCDATLIAINATMALSLTERAFIAQHVVGRRIPRIFAVLTHLDEVQPSDRAAVVHHVRERLSVLHPDISLAVAHDELDLPADGSVAAAGPGAIAAALAAWAADAEHRARRHRQLLGNLRQFLTLVESELTVRRTAATLAAEERRRELDAERFRFDHARLDWEDLRLDLQARCESAVEWLEGRLGAGETAARERLEHELRRAPDPGAWWQQDLPFRLRQELGALAGVLGESLHRRMMDDATWLGHQIESRFARRLGPASSDPFLSFPAGTEDGGFGDQRDMTGVRVLTRIGAGAATLLGFLLYGPLGIAASVGTGLISEYLIRRHADARRDELARALTQVLDRSLHHGTEAIRQRLIETYESLLAETARQERIWSEARQEAFAASRPNPGDESEAFTASFAALSRFQALVTAG